MSSEIVRIIVAIILLGHGVGHVLGLWAAVGKPLTDSHSSHSWLLSRVVGQGVAGVLMFLLFLVALIGFVGAGLGLFDWLIAADQWLDWAVWASIVSIVALTLYPRGFPTLFPNVIGALLVDAIVLIMMWGQTWPTALFE